MKKGTPYYIYTYIIPKSASSQMDLIIGPFHLKPFERMINYVKDKDILLINPMTPRADLVIDNKNMVKVKPSYSYQMHWLEEIIKDKYTDNNIFIFAMDSASMQYTEIMKEIALRNIEEFSYVPNKRIKRVIKKYQDALKNEEVEFDSKLISDMEEHWEEMERIIAEEHQRLADCVCACNNS